MSEQLNSFEIEEIMSYLPHRYPMLLIDRVLDYKVGETLHAIKNVTANEPIFTGHFPGRPVFPGVLILEAMAQATGLLGFKTIEAQKGEVDPNELYLFAAIDKARFKQPVVPGDQIHFHVKFIKERRGIWKFSGEAFVDGKLAACAEIMCARRVL
ncbi:3-hydroxyacyl-[acyl-carrier-protein] dehydratase FabZ [Psychrosphaera saromensis]|uniref:3-hydroxyacyl-[acyl-carrier-protein] dehydratase FabZ n=1 Tax=Psychrosphaera saromensis TaxID=716813 RepID=A0A2S7UUK7_9GAMM|nr:3-hydroxyacyl-ACP dehydratase FabZ [Psychrosphaera saromensis]PQJ53674.1 3-hydroxyacyl-[acyl-carrier-protein] dehydratase FabZ [Psychrosphaera saromensis]GHB63312.1 3-hydroxyacyl-[acyl-carrier-protein] dehydratase FabZ [Psychrosphaera saromensis]GLQ15554.1 3-hydroxyacyl-[acyl-carrier-protein] dehydratase FabZ [Psychrosphaera saromensis]